jgi:hypothetical protein
MIRIDAEGCTTATLRHITAEQLLHLGTRQVVYLKSGMRDGKLALILYSADGTPLVTLDTLEEVVQMVAANGLSFASVH